MGQFQTVFSNSPGLPPEFVCSYTALGGTCHNSTPKSHTAHELDTKQIRPMSLRLGNKKRAHESDTTQTRLLSLTQIIKAKKTKDLFFQCWPQWLVGKPQMFKTGEQIQGWSPLDPTKLGTNFHEVWHTSKGLIGKDQGKNVKWLFQVHLIQL